jgi:hypothetical protein
MQQRTDSAVGSERRPAQISFGHKTRPSALLILTFVRAERCDGVLQQQFDALPRLASSTNNISMRFSSTPKKP